MDGHGDGAMSAAAGKLFRAEALHAQQQRWLGELRLVTPLSARVLVAGTVLIVAVLAVFASLGTYTRRVHATGMLAPATGLLTLAAPAAGRVQRIAIHEGAPVAAGQVLAVVSSERQSLAGDTSSAVLLKSGGTSDKQHTSARCSRCVGAAGDHCCFHKRIQRI
jgi:membrane fusion protein